MVSGGQVPNTITIKLQACRLQPVACDEPVAINEADAPQNGPPKWGKDAKWVIGPDGHIVIE